MPLIPLLTSSGVEHAVTQTDSAGLTDTRVLDLAKVQTDSAGLTDQARFEQAKAATDSAGLTDTTALTVGKVQTDSAGLTDTATAESGKAVAQTDSAGLTDSALVGYFAGTAFTVTYAFTGSSPNATTTASNITAGPVTANADISLGYITSSYASQPALQVASTSVTSATAAAAVTNGHHFNFTLTPDAGYALDVANLTFNVAKGGSSVRGVVVRSSLDGYTADLYSADITTIRPFWTPIVIDLSAVPPTSSAVTFRVYIYTATTAQFVEFDDVNITGGLISAPASISWMGETWNVAQRAAAGDFVNAFDRTMVSINGSGHLVLRVRNYGGGVLRGAEIASAATGGYGTYIWELDGQTSNMHDNLVLGGMFTYDSDAGTPGRNELDSAEQYTDASGGVRLKHNTWMADPSNSALRGPWNAARVAGNEIDTLTDSSQTNVMIWEPTRLTFRTYHGLSTAPGDLYRESILNAGDAVTINAQATTAVIPTPATEQVYFNLWVRPDWYANSDPDTVTDFDIAVRSYSFQAAVAVTDSAGLTDTTVFDLAKVQTDSAGLTDQAALTRALVYTDSAGLTDSATGEVAKTVAATDSAGLTDSALLDQAKTHTDSAGLTDATALALAKTQTDSAGLTDTSVVQSGKLLEVTDSAGLTDTQAFARSLGVTDSAGLTDAQGLTLSRAFTDSAGLTDSASVGLVRAVEATDSAGLTDSRALARLLGIDDSAGLTDAASLAQAISRAFTDSAGLTDSATVLAVALQMYGTAAAGHRMPAAGRVGSGSASTGQSGQALVGSGSSGRG